MKIKEHGFPVLIFAHARPKCFEQLVAGSITNFANRNVWLFLDGPRDGSEVKQQGEIKRIFQLTSPKNASNILVAEKNLTSRFAIPEAIRRFFLKREAGIFLEEDLLVGDAFFEFADYSLAKLQSDTSLAGFTGFRPPISPTISNRAVAVERCACFSPWGWGTTKQAWSRYKDSCLNGSYLDLVRGATKFSGSRWINLFWLANLMLTSQGKNSSWFFRWQYTCIRQGKEYLVPSVNLVGNSGFGASATHTSHMKDVTLGVYLKHGEVIRDLTLRESSVDNANYYVRAWDISVRRWIQCVASVFIPARIFYWARELRNTSGKNGKAVVEPLTASAKMLQANLEQSRFYDAIHSAEAETGVGGYAENEHANLLTRVWAELRYRQQNAVKEAGVEDAMKQAHRKWINAKEGGEFLEVGCFSGSPSTFELARAAAIYRGIDLSPLAVSRLNERFADAGLQGKACAESGDFLLMNDDKQYDLIYAHGVLHHFENPEPLFAKLARLLKPDGQLIFVDPCAVNPVYRAFRMIYRPFQSDAAWEWPFRSVTVTALERRFEIVEGFGWGRKSLLLSVLTGLPAVGRLITPLYVRLAKGEVTAGWHDNVWMNSMVTACYRPRQA